VWTAGSTGVDEDVVNGCHGPVKQLAEAAVQQPRRGEYRAGSACFRRRFVTQPMR